MTQQTTIEAVQTLQAFNHRTATCITLPLQRPLASLAIFFSFSFSYVMLCMLGSFQFSCFMFCIICSIRYTHRKMPQLHCRFNFFFNESNQKNIRTVTEASHSSFALHWPQWTIAQLERIERAELFESNRESRPIRNSWCKPNNSIHTNIGFRWYFIKFKM